MLWYCVFVWNCVFVLVDTIIREHCYKSECCQQMHRALTALGNRKRPHSASWPTTAPTTATTTTRTRAPTYRHTHIHTHTDRHVATYTLYFYTVYIVQSTCESNRPPAVSSSPHEKSYRGTSSNFVCAPSTRMNVFNIMWFIIWNLKP